MQIVRSALCGSCIKLVTAQVLCAEQYAGAQAAANQSGLSQTAVQKVHCMMLNLQHDCSAVPCCTYTVCSLPVLAGPVPAQHYPGLTCCAHWSKPDLTAQGCTIGVC